jgi:predicted PurR-regulated permease PerM/GAF domain-containing protein
MNPEAPTSRRSRPPQRRKSASEALTGLWAIALTTFVLGVAYFAREVIIPLALAILLTFLLAPFVRKLERWITRIPAVVLTMMLIVAGIVGTGWVLTNQVVDLAEQLPNYKENIRAKLRSIKVPEGRGFTKLSETLTDLKKDLPAGFGAAEGQDAAPVPFPAPPPAPAAVPEKGAMQIWQSFAVPVLGPLGTTALVLLLMTFMLLKTEDLQSRFIRLAGQGRISSTTRALDDAGSRIRKYLLMQLVVNVTYGAVLAVGLFFIGVPNALLWGSIATVLRFVPYIGPWIAAAFPVIMSLAVGTSWTAPLLTIAFFIVIELLSNNVMEPLLYGSSTGVSAVALIVAAVFWTWMWGPAGLVLATPLTVCMVVMGRHIPQLSFLSVLLSEEDALTPAEDVYHRLLRKGEHDESEVVEAYLKANPLASLYDDVLIPVIASGEDDFAAGMVDEEQRNQVAGAVRAIVADIDHRETLSDETVSSSETCRIVCLPARAERDALAAEMLAHSLDQEGYQARYASGKNQVREMLTEIGKHHADIVIISLMPPTHINHARNLCQKIRAASPEQTILVGLWGSNTDLGRARETLGSAGAGEVVTRISEAIAFADEFTRQWAESEAVSPRPIDEEERQRTLEELNLLADEPSPVLEKLTSKLSRVFEMPIALVTLLDGDRQFFKAGVGLSEELQNARETPRDLSVCGHVVAANATLVVEDLLRDRRFANNPFLRAHNLRFYAGAPLRASNGQPLGTLCLMDIEPRRLSQRELRLLEEQAAELSQEIGTPPAAGAN